MAAIYNLEFTRIDTEVSIYLNGRLRATKFVSEELKINVKYQFYVERARATYLTIVFYNGQLESSRDSKPWNQSRISFTLYKSGTRRPIAMVHDYWDKDQSRPVKVKEYSYTLHGDD